MNLAITEGISGLWHYHLSDEAKKMRGLCGAQTMHTAMPLTAWKVPFGENFPKRPTWCEACSLKAAQPDQGGAHGIGSSTDGGE
ncbi:hypothetical protein ABIC89_001015 [Variovorax boronicumulans]|uniref:hypothetical protein n=1 Tax=Variovorax boronicumulans TaxID=436515 RepID=UPI0033998504